MTERLADGACERHRPDLMRLAYDRVVASHNEVEVWRHLDDCPACRAELESARECIADLRSALAPEPADEALANRILARVDETLAARRPLPRLLRLARWGGLAVAACLLPALFRPLAGELGRDADTQVSSVAAEFDELEMGEVLAALALLQWDDPLERAIPRVEETLNGLEKQLSGEQRFVGALPWSADDDWDLPVEGAEAPSHRDGPGSEAMPEGVRRSGASL